MTAKCIPSFVLGLTLAAGCGASLRSHETAKSVMWANQKDQVQAEIYFAPDGTPVAAYIFVSTQGATISTIATRMQEGTFVIEIDGNVLRKASTKTPLLITTASDRIITIPVESEQLRQLWSYCENHDAVELVKELEKLTGAN